MGNCCKIPMDTYKSSAPTPSPECCIIYQDYSNAVLQSPENCPKNCINNSSMPQCRIQLPDGVQHMAEREFENEGEDPTVDSKIDPIFIQQKIHQSWYTEIVCRLMKHDNRRCNSTSFIYMDNSTVSKPDPRSTIRAVALAICVHLRADNSKDNDFDELDIFNECFHPMPIDQPPDENPNNSPSVKTVHRFIRKIFNMAQLSPECAIVTIIYLERLLIGGKMILTLKNWKRIVLCAILLASKVWDDQAVWNVDYCQILDELKVDDVNELERQFLEIIQFNINVPSSIYTKYFFDIRSLTIAASEFNRLGLNRARELEACSNKIFDSTEGLADPKRYSHRRRTTSLEFNPRRHDILLVIS